MNHQTNSCGSIPFIPSEHPLIHQTSLCWDKPFRPFTHHECSWETPPSSRLQGWCHEIAGSSYTRANGTGWAPEGRWWTSQGNCCNYQLWWRLQCWRIFSATYDWGLQGWMDHRIVVLNHLVIPWINERDHRSILFARDPKNLWRIDPMNQWILLVQSRVDS